MTEPTTPSEPATVGGPPPRSAVARLLDADWPAVGAAVVPILLALIVGSQLAALTAWLAGGSPTDGGNGVGGYLSALSMLACAAFFGGITASGGSGDDIDFNISYSVHVVPLGITALVLATAWFAIRRGARGDLRERRAFAAQVSGVVALVVLGLALLSRIDAGLGGSDASVHADAVESFLGSLALMLATTMLAARDSEPWLAARLGSWMAPVRGALSGLIAACALGFLAGLVAAVTTVVVHDGSLVDVLKGIPLALAFLPALGLAVAHLALLGTLDTSVVFLGAGGGVGLLDRHDASAWYWLLVVIAPVIIAIAIIGALRAAGDVDDATARRTAYRVAAPLSIGWMLLALAGRIRGGFFSAGPTVWQTFVLPAVWTGVLGFFLAGPLRRFATPRAARRRRNPLQLSTLCLGFVVASVLLAAGAAAGAQQDQGSGRFGLSSEESGSATASVGGTLVPKSFSSDSSADLQMIAEQVAKSEQVYFAEHNEYTANAEPLRGYDLELPVGVEWSASSTGDEVCAVVKQGIGSWTYDSTNTAQPVQQGDHC